MQRKKIAIIGGGVAGVSSALYLSQLGLEITLFEKQKSLISGPPFCHLHAGGNLYREISDKDCVTLLRQSIAFLKFYPFIVDYRPTVIAIPTEDKGEPTELIPRLDLLIHSYKELIAQDSTNEVLGEPHDYYRLYTKDDILALQKRNAPKTPQTSDEWMISVSQQIDLNRIKFPLILVQEYGLNLFRLASGTNILLQKDKNITLHTHTEVTDVNYTNNQWHLQTKTQTENFDYLINASGFEIGKIDDILGVPCKRMVEFKSAYITQNTNYEETTFPEIIFHGTRGTPQGMGQFTPYPHGYFQLHAMTQKGTLYQDGLVANTPLSCQPKLNEKFIQKIEDRWNPQEIEQRTTSAIKHLAQFIPSFIEAKTASKPLYGAQQIPGEDATLRVGEVSFPSYAYARCEIVKVSSVLDMIGKIIENLITLKILPNQSYPPLTLETIDETKLEKDAKAICKQRAYPQALASLTTPKRNTKALTFDIFKSYPKLIHYITQKSLKMPYQFSLALHTNQKRETIIQNRASLHQKICHQYQIPSTTKLTYIVANQTHSNHIKVIQKHEHRGWDNLESAIEDCDALITNQTNIILSILTADCVPILLYDKKKHIISAIHAGWRGTQKKIVAKTIIKMQEVYQSNPEDIIALIAPSISKCCYEVGKEVAQHFLDIPQAYLKKENRYYLDLPFINEYQLLQSGLKKEHIQQSHICTSCEVQNFFSYRKEQGCDGRFMSMIGLL